MALFSAPDESDYQTEYEEELPEVPKDAYADFQSTRAALGSDSVRGWLRPSNAPWLGLSSRPQAGACLRVLALGLLPTQVMWPRTSPPGWQPQLVCTLTE